MFLPELNPILSEFNFQQAVVAHFLQGGAPDLAGTFGGRRYQTQVTLLDNLLTAFPEETTRTRGNSYMAPNGLSRGPAFGVPESIHCPGGKVQRDPIDALKRPPCFVAPPSLLNGKQIIRLGRGEAPYRKPPQGLEGTTPADPYR